MAYYGPQDGVPWGHILGQKFISPASYFLKKINVTAFLISPWPWAIFHDHELYIVELLKIQQLTLDRVDP
jgi:hypothetical protein